MDNPYDSPLADTEHALRDPNRCPSCGGREFREGRMTYRLFVPDSWPWLRLRQGLNVKSVACTDCGHVRDFVSKDDLDSLRQS